ncbi:hypothetical protein JHK86_006672 [Glycine max]|nr:hypothetical protein JHK86_006672 [Glycine max]
MDVVITDDGDFDPHTTWGYGSQGVRDTELPNQTTNSLSVISWNCRGTISRGFGILIKDMMKQYKSSFVILMEIHTSVIVSVSARIWRYGSQFYSRRPETFKPEDARDSSLLGGDDRVQWRREVSRREGGNQLQ